ncbi:MAG: FtsX-like permease family protein [Cellulosilyticum sp.]|nr:FtsX-like permease family protein [Cellulosilyticum sp.]
MNILIKYTLKSMMEKKFRSFLIILAIALAGGLFLASSRLTNNISHTYSNMLMNFYGEADIMITTNKESPTNYVSLSGCDKVEGVANRVIPFISGAAEYKKPGESVIDYISLSAYPIQDYLAINKLVVLEGSIENFTGAKLILSKKGAQKLGLSVGDEITLDIQGKRKVTLAAIVDNEGIFKFEEGTTQGMMPFETICKYIKSNNRAAIVYIDVKEDMDIDEAIATYQEAYPNYTVERTVNVEELEQQMSTITSPFMLMTLIVIFMSAFIIYSSFKVIMLEKLPVVGTFRSVGATKSAMNGVLLMEAIFYGVIGGIGACLLGTGALYILSALILGMRGGEGVEMSCTVPAHTYIITFFIGLVMAILSTILPIMSVFKISLKDIILNNRPHKGRKYLRGTIIGVLLIIIGLMIPEIIAGDMLMMTSVIGFFVVIIGMIKVVPVIVLYASQGLGFLFNLIFGNIGELATKNIKKTVVF